jgi:hypothetical protein
MNATLTAIVEEAAPRSRVAESGQCQLSATHPSEQLLTEGV